jgi:glutathione S-transferase
MVLEEKGLEYRLIEEDLSSLSEALLRLHPEGRVPLLIHRGRAIHESSIITEYLEESFPGHGPRLMPEDAGERAEVRLWTYWCNQILKPDLDAFKYERKRLVEAEWAALLERMTAHLSKLEAALAPGPFLLGKSFTLADVHVFPFYRQLQRAQPDFGALLPTRALDPWLERIVGRPSFARVMAKPESARK